MSRAELLTTELKRVDHVSPKQGIAKHRKMAQSPYLFYRGSAQIFYADLLSQTLPIPDALLEIPLTAIMGDCHTSNFGFLTEEGSHGDTVIFAPNDFDDACMGHAVWDLMRYLCSLQLVFVHCQSVENGLVIDSDYVPGKPLVSAAHVEQAMMAFLTQYTTMCGQAIQSTHHLYQAIESVNPDTKLYRYYRKALRRAAGGRDFHTKSALAKAVEQQNGVLRFKDNPQKFLRIDSALFDQLSLNFAPYMDDAILDIVSRQNAGTGSVNMERYYFLVGPNDKDQDDAFTRSHIVEVKQQRHAAPLHYFPMLHPVNQLNPAHLTAKCQRRMQRRADLLLDEVKWNNQHWLVRSRHHAKVGINPLDIGMGNKNVNGSFVEYAGYCGKALALAHCRSDRRSTAFEQAIVDLVPIYKDQLADSAIRYAQQVAKDCEWLKTEFSD